MAVLMVSLRVGDRALPLAWMAEAGFAHVGFAGQRPILEHVRCWLPAGARVMLSADRFYPSVALFDRLHEQGWHYRLRLKNNLLVEVGHGEDCTTGALADGVRERYFPSVRLFASGVTMNLGILREVGHPDPGIIAMNCAPTRTCVLDYGARWAIEPLFSDLKGRGFHLEHSQLQHADRLERLLLMMALALYWCVALGQEDARNHPTPLEKKRKLKQTLLTGLSENSTAVWSLGSNAGYVA
ncbi:MAG: transposase [Candidatus Contendobacter sp.]